MRKLDGNRYRAMAISTPVEKEAKFPADWKRGIPSFFPKPKNRPDQSRHRADKLNATTKNTTINAVPRCRSAPLPDPAFATLVGVVVGLGVEVGAADVNPAPPPINVTILVLPRLAVFGVRLACELRVDGVSTACELCAEVTVCGEDSVVLAAAETGDPVFACPAPDIMPVYVWL